MDDRDAVETRWTRGLQEAARDVYARVHGVEPEPPAAGRPRSRWAVSPRAAATVACVVALIAAVAWWGLRPGDPVPLVPASTVSSAAASPWPSPSAVLLVHVSGAVQRPGLVELEPGARVADAVRAAGGLVEEADESSVNLARAVDDGEHVLVAVRGAAVAGRADGLIDLNRADADALEELPGVGPVLAARIVADREAHGPYRGLEDLGRVSGVGPAILGGLAGVATVG